MPVKLCLMLLLLSLSGCNKPISNQLVEDWPIMKVEHGKITPSQNTIAYTVNQSLYTDNALKLRTITIPEGKKIVISDKKWLFPVGTIFSKTFFFPKNSHTRDTNFGVGRIDLDLFDVIETRVLHHTDAGWVPYSYQWNDDTAKRFRAGGVRLVKTIGVNNAHMEYVIPSESDCYKCHTVNMNTNKMEPLGFKALQLKNTDGLIDARLLQLFSKDDKKTILVSEKRRSPKDHDARLYLDVHCAHCHNPLGSAKQVGLSFRYDSDMSLIGLCKTPVVYGNATTYVLKPAVPHQSQTYLRLSSIEHNYMMPSIGRTTTDYKGVGLLGEWISQMRHNCN